MLSIARIARLIVFVTVLGAVLGSPMTAMAASGRFVDDDGSRYEPAIETVAAAGVMTACNSPSTSRFCPGAAVTRGAMAVYLVRTFRLTATSGARFHHDRPSGT